MTKVKKLALVPYTFVLMNWAAVLGLYNFVSGRFDVWHAPVEEEAAE